jgi:hypothetical protein
MTLPGFVSFLVFCVIFSFALIVIFKYDLRFDQSIDPGYYAEYPGINKTISVIKLIPRYIALSTLLAWLASLAYNYIAGRTGWPVFVNLTLADFKRFAFIRLDTFWHVATGAACVLVLRDMALCVHNPLQYDLSKPTAPVPQQPVEDDLPRDDQDHWDVFISYKSEDVDLARRIANQLIASGLKVWFNEYRVLLQNFDQFQNAIDFGIAHSDWAICLTNNRYIGSEYCRNELEQLLNKLPSENVLEIMIPREDLPHQKYAALDNCPAYVGNDLPGIFTFIQAHTGWALKPLLPIVINTEPSTHISTCLQRDVVLDTTDWQVTKHGRVVFGSTNMLAMKYLHRQDQYSFNVNLVCGKEYARAGKRLGQAIDDRQMFNLLREHAERYTGRLNAKVYGLHLILHEGLSQFAVTYRMFGYWTRKYSIVFPNHATNQNAEFVFTFGFDGSFKQYCENVHIMDRMVQSLVWK